jgi:hypothetical protein
MSDQPLTSRDIIAVYDRHGAYSEAELAAVILRLERERDAALQEAKRAETKEHAWTEIGAQAETEAAQARQALADAWKLLGRCDMAFELIATARSLRTAKETARKLRSEIQQMTAKGVIR